VARHFKPDIYPKVEDDATILVDYGDMQCTIQASWNWSFNRKDMEVYGTSGMLLAPSSELLLSRNQSKNQVTSTKVTDKDVHVFTDPFQYFIAVIRGKEQMPEYGLYAPANNVIVVKILEAARKSAATGKTVKL
jgi:predicted dehydrogenase